MIIFYSAVTGRLFMKFCFCMTVVFVNMGYARRNISFAVDGYTVTGMNTYTTSDSQNLLHASYTAGERLNLPKGTVTTVVMRLPQATGIKAAGTQNKVRAGVVYGVDGRRAYNDGTDSLPKGIYVSDGKKTVK